MNTGYHIPGTLFKNTCNQSQPSAERRGAVINHFALVCAHPDEVLGWIRLYVSATTAHDFVVSLPFVAAYSIFCKQFVPDLNK